jgi:hypothetical protein
MLVTTNWAVNGLQDAFSRAGNNAWITDAGADELRRLLPEVYIAR